MLGSIHSGVWVKYRNCIFLQYKLFWGIGQVQNHSKIKLELVKTWWWDGKFIMLHTAVLGLPEYLCREIRVYPKTSTATRYYWMRPADHIGLFESCDMLLSTISTLSLLTENNGIYYQIFTDNNQSAMSKKKLTSRRDSFLFYSESRRKMESTPTLSSFPFITTQQAKLICYECYTACTIMVLTSQKLLCMQKALHIYQIAWTQ